MWLVIGNMVGMWLVCDQYAVVMWSVQWLVGGWYVTIMNTNAMFSAPFRLVCYFISGLLFWATLCIQHCKSREL